MADQNTVDLTHLSSIARDRLVQARVALQRARADGKMTARLEELVPQYLHNVPVDPFDGAPVKYNPDRGILYSVGIDRIDSGGAVSREGVFRDRNEPVITLPPAWKTEP